MAIAKVFDRIAYQCDVCRYVWLANHAELPKRCANIHGRHIAWNNAGIRRRAQKQARRFESQEFVRQIIEQPVRKVTYVRDEYSQE